MNPTTPETNSSKNFETIQIMMKRFGIDINDIKKISTHKFNLKTSHKKAVLLAGNHTDTLNFDFLTFKDKKIETQYPVNEIIQKVIDYGNQYVDFFDALRIFDIETKQTHSYADSVKAFIDFEFDWNTPKNNEIVLNFKHNKSPLSNLISNNTVISSGTHQSTYIVFDLEGNMTVNRMNVFRKQTIEAWGNNTENNFKEYGVLTEMVNI